MTGKNVKIKIKLVLLNPFEVFFEFSPCKSRSSKNNKTKLSREKKHILKRKIRQSQQILSKFLELPLVISFATT